MNIEKEKKEKTYVESLSYSWDLLVQFYWSETTQSSHFYRIKKIYLNTHRKLYWSKLYHSDG